MAIYARDHFDCVYCRGLFPPAEDGKGLTLDHVVPRSAGGGHGPSNVVTACTSCNFSRQARELTAVEKRRAAVATGKPIDRVLGRRLAAGG